MRKIATTTRIAIKRATGSNAPSTTRKLVKWVVESRSFQGSAMERDAFEAPPHVIETQEAGVSDALHSQAEPGNEFIH